MNKKINLFFPSGGSNSLWEIMKYLKSNDKFRFQLFSCDIAKDSLIKHAVDKYVNSPPIKNESEYKKFMISFSKKNKIEVIIPLINQDVVFTAKYKEKFKKMGAATIVSNYSICKLAVNKTSCFKFLKKNKIGVPDFFEVKSAEEFKKAAKELGYPKKPICIKPACYPDGSGRGFRIIDPDYNVNKQMFYALTSKMYYVSFDMVIQAMKTERKFPPMLVMEYLPNEEYSVYCLVEKGHCHYIVPNLRQKLTEMYSAEAIIVKNPEIENIAREICSLFGFDYNINIQFKYSKDNVPKVVEINPRVAGTIMLPVAAGVDLLTFSIMMALDKDFPKNKKIKYGTKIIRYYTDIYQYQNEQFTLQKETLE